MTFMPTPHQIYKHFKGNLYQIIAIAEHSETAEQLVIYQALYGDFKFYARPLSMFMEKVDRVKYPEATQEYRFELQQLDGCNPARESVSAQESPIEEPLIDPMVLEFLDADSYEKKLNILTALHHRITDEMITTMAIASDIEVGEGDLEARYDSLKSCLITLEKYECNRLR